MQADLSPVIAATAQWLTRTFPAPDGALASALCEAQARQAVTVAAWLCYPTEMDAGLVEMAGPGGSARLDGLTGAGPYPAEDAWRTWVDEVVASWAVCLLTDPELARLAAAAVGEGGHLAGVPVEFRRLVMPDERDQGAAVLLRHPDLVAPVAELHRARLLDVLKPRETLVA